MAFSPSVENGDQQLNSWLEHINFLRSEALEYEVETKHPVEDFEAIKHQILELGGTFQKTANQRDQYFAPPHKDYGQTDEALRVRSTDQGNFVTYKGPKIDQETKTRHELEIPVAAPQRFEELFACLDFKAVVAVEKRRDYYELQFQGLPFEVVLDDVKGLGKFVELETACEESKLEQAKSAVKELAKELGLSDSIRTSYLELLMESH